MIYSLVDSSSRANESLSSEVYALKTFIYFISMKNLLGQWEADMQNRWRWKSGFIMEIIQMELSFQFVRRWKGSLTFL